jgi:hypothetical protein
MNSADKTDSVLEGYKSQSVIRNSADKTDSVLEGYKSQSVIRNSADKTDSVLEGYESQSVSCTDSCFEYHDKSNSLE